MSDPNIPASLEAAPNASSSPLADLRHDLRNPVGNVIGYAEMLIEEATESGRADLVPDLEKVRAAGKRLLLLIDERMSDAAFAALTPDPFPNAGRGRVALVATSVLPEGEVGIAADTPAPFAGQGPGARADESGYLLVVDDMEHNRDVLARRLERQGHTVAVAPGGAEALALLSGSGFDLVLLDIMMPGMDGYEVLARIKAHPDLRHTPVIMITALDDLESVVRCIEIGAADYLTKPFNPVLLRARVGACLRDKRAHDREAGLFAELETGYRRLQELEKLRDDLTHMIIHDLRTPLTSLLSGMQTVPMLGDLNAEQTEMVGMSVEGGQTLLGMINDLLDVGKMEAGQMALDRSSLELAQVLNAAVAQVHVLAREKGVRLIARFAPSAAPIVADEEKVRRVLVNLLGNALKFTPKGGQITLETQEQDGITLLRVRDTGEGIPLSEQGRIFNKFGQVESRKGGRKMSTGLGLTFCKLVVEAHGGAIGVESVPGEGSTFWFTLPTKAPSAN